MGKGKTPPLVQQQFNVVTLVGVSPSWKPPQKGLDELGVVRLTRSQEVVVLTFATPERATNAFGALFVDGALGAADLMPDETRWVSDDMKRVAMAPRVAPRPPPRRPAAPAPRLARNAWKRGRR